ncbi:YihY/virulence factor BrkB family protein [Undibacterium arcticum]|uniref:YihY/virulence factor BrkB family protein n=1 Tax=Undibacterium arcticum TaxID=1762892 RepID=A0ABV7F9U8_9BURK
MGPLGKRNARLTARMIASDPLRFALQVMRSFRANQGFLLAGAVAYYTLLSVVPLFTFLLLTLSSLLDEASLLSTLNKYLTLLLPNQTSLIVEQARSLLAHRQVVGSVLTVALLFFGSMTFSILENAMSVIFTHRAGVRRRHFLVSALLPYLFILFLGVGLLVTAIISSLLQTLGAEQINIFGRELSLDRLSIVLLYLLGLGGEILMLTAIYMVMPVGHLRLRHALIGGSVAALLWEITRRILVWYFTTLSLVNVVYGSLASTIVALLTFEFAAIILLLGAQVIAEYERLMLAGAWSETSTPMQV